MKKYINISSILGIILILGSFAGLINIKKTGCASGYWGYGSCGIEALVSSVVVLGIVILCIAIQSVRSKNNIPDSTLYTDACKRSPSQCFFYLPSHQHLPRL